LQNRLARYEIKAMESARAASQKLGKDVKKTYGLSPSISEPSPPTPFTPINLPHAPADLAPVAPIQLPPPVNPPSTLSIPQKPTLMAEPNAPQAHQFMPQPEPNLAPAIGSAERTGDLLEKNLLGGKGVVNNAMKLAGLKYLLGSSALPAEAAYLGLKGLTSPSGMGKAIRMTFKQGGIEAINSWAQQYPSYHDGILDNPQERRSLTKEIEDDAEIPLEQKAIFQSKINRGKPLQARL
jgi:hypothetical protein